MLLLYSDKWIFVFFFYDRRWFAVSGEDDKVIFERIELLTNRSDNLLEISLREIGAPDTSLEEGISTEHTIWVTDKAHTPASMTRGM